MCGFLGEISKNKINYESVVTSNKETICRGPDEYKNIFGSSKQVFKTDNEYYLSIGFNRLAIMELSNLGSQPMISEDKKYSLIFNGEIFNHESLRRELINSGCTFSSKTSDTEVLFKGLIEYGIDYINKLIGQFSIIFIDNNSNKLFLIRDRLGQKPLFYNYQDSKITFGSNLKSLATLNDNFDISEQSTQEYLASGVVSSPNTILKDFYKIEPGHFLTYCLMDFKILNITPYWDIDSFAGEKKYDENKFFEIFESSVLMRSKADVEVASFLSGGIDSSSIIKKQSELDMNVNTFSMGFSRDNYDESKWFSMVSKKYNTNHKQKTISSKLDLDKVLESVDIFDEPYADSSTIPSYFLAKEISNYYKVAISGDGGDELLGGYEHIKRVLNSKDNFLINSLYNVYSPKIGTGSNLLKYNKDKKIYHESFFIDRKLIELLKLDYSHNFKSKYFKTSSINYKDHMIADYKFYLSEMMMLKVDRTSMANSLEIRSPFVDHRLVEFAISSDFGSFFHEKSKYLTKNYLAQDFNTEFLNRPKQGFAFQLEDWVFDNLNYLKDYFTNGYINSIDKKILNSLSIIKTRINAHRIWKIFFLERYLETLKL